ncbi:unnamed protein product [Soboliphyme baturini]|uniref:HCO3_cotransp domain-containing protein n=1 Tax=Soboliphyme baturini TaxID=241478 RepID=A0A183IMM7_9BILA|nr:unnamed protein product [Soboliphyme baturini]
MSAELRRDDAQENPMDHVDKKVAKDGGPNAHNLCHYLVNSANQKCASDAVTLPFGHLADSKSNPDVISSSATNVAAGRQASQEDKNPLYQVSNEFIRIVGGQPMKAFLKRPIKVTNVVSTHKIVVQNEREELLQISSPVESPKLPKKKCGYCISDSLQTNWSERLKRRKILFFRRIKITDFCLGFALTGIAITVAENEVAFSAPFYEVNVIIFLISIASP